MGAYKEVQAPILGLKENKGQFVLLLIVNAFVGGMVGLERSIFPELALSEFGLDQNSAILSFIVAFGFAKAIANYFAGKLANRFGRKHLLTLGWIVGIPVPFMIIYANNWNIIVLANILLGINQGLAWSSTVVMKIDLVGPKQRGLAMGLNEFTGYLAVGIFAYLSSFLAVKYGVRPAPFYLGIGLSLLGLFTTLLFIKDTRAHMNTESIGAQNEKDQNVFIETSFRNKTLSSTTQAGLVNNLNDGMIWGLLPVFLLNSFTDLQIGWIAGIYPAVWGIGQLVTGKMSDSFNNKTMIFGGMLLQGLAILALPFAESFPHLVLIAVFLGIGTALVYPTFFVVISKNTHPSNRAESIGVFRLWRDSGYAIGALASGIIADVYGIEAAILAIGSITCLSAFVVRFRME